MSLSPQRRYIKNRMQERKALFAAKRLSAQESSDSDEEPSSGPDEMPEDKVLLAERSWLRRTKAISCLTKIEKILLRCGSILNLSNKVSPSIRISAKDATSERVHLSQRNGLDTLKASVLLLGENIIQTEVMMKYPKMPGGMLRSSAQPDVQWKLQQLQDAGNYCAQALNFVVRSIDCVNDLTADEDMGSPESENILDSIIIKVGELVGQARSSLCLPRKRTLLELCSFAPTRCFNPPLPADLVFSYYIASTRIVCAAYHMTAKSNGTQSLTVTTADCQLPQLVELLCELNNALSIAEELRFQLSTLDAHASSFPAIDSPDLHF